MPERAGGAALLLGIVGLAFAATAMLGSAVAREWLAPPEPGPATSITVSETAPDGDETIGVDIRIADLMATGSELSGVAPRTATSGIGSDVDRDLFSDGTPRNATSAPPPEDDQQYLY